MSFAKNGFKLATPLFKIQFYHSGKKMCSDKCTLFMRKLQSSNTDHQVVWVHRACMYARTHTEADTLNLFSGPSQTVSNIISTQEKHSTFHSWTLWYTIQVWYIPEMIMLFGNVVRQTTLSMGDKFSSLQWWKLCLGEYKIQSRESL